MMRSLIVTREPYRVSPYWLGGFVSIVCPLPRHWRFASALSSPHRSTALSSCPPTNIRFRFFDVSASASKDFLSHYILGVLRSTLPKNGFYSGHAMLIVILHTLRQPFPCQLLLSKCWGPCGIRRKPPPTDTFFHKRHTQGKLLQSAMS